MNDSQQRDDFGRLLCLRCGEPTSGGWFCDKICEELYVEETEEEDLAERKNRKGKQ